MTRTATSAFGIVVSRVTRQADKPGDEYYLLRERRRKVGRQPLVTILWKLFLTVAPYIIIVFAGNSRENIQNVAVEITLDIVQRVLILLAQNALYSDEHTLLIILTMK